MSADVASLSNLSLGCVIALDLGGTWIKGIVVPLDNPSAIHADAKRWPNPVASMTHAGQFATFLQRICIELAGGQSVESVCIATAGEVDALGDRYLVTAAHLGLMGTNGWQAAFQKSMNCPCTLINDAEAFLLGVAERGKLSTRGNIGVMVIGTGLGFCVVRDGRWWKPARRLNLLGSAQIHGGSYDHWISASNASEHAGGDLVAMLREPRWESLRSTYLDALAAAAASASTLYWLEEILLGGGLIDAARNASVDLADEISRRMPPRLPRGMKTPAVTSIENANQTLLDGAAAFALGNQTVESARFSANYATLATEQPATGEIDCGTTREVVQQLWQAEQEAGERLEASLDTIANVAIRMADAIEAGGRVISVGAGTSGRIAALDAVEMPCTYSTAADRFVAVIAGGASDAALTIEENNEEDASAVPDLLLLQPTSRDVVIGISASGSAFFVRSALAFARQRGAYTVLIHEGTVEKPFFDASIRLGSGSELVSGSTRMKAGTATKKVMNFLSTAAMIKLGKVRSGYMIDFECSNEKLRKRAMRIFRHVSGLSDIESDRVLQAHGYRLGDAIKSIGR